MDSVRIGYKQLGIDKYYELHKNDYYNPHADKIEYLLTKYITEYDIGKNILDLCCGSGEVTKIIVKSMGDYNIEGLDKYTYDLYTKNTGLECLKMDFKDIVCGALKNKRYDTIICSFAMHLCEQSMLSMLLYQLSKISDTLIILTPHKRPEIKQWWKLEYSEKYDGVTLRVYKSRNEM